MSRITEKPAVGAMSPWYAATGTSNYTGTATPPAGNQAFAALPATGAQPATGTGFYDASFCTLVGQKFDTSDGRELVLVQNGNTAIAAGLLCQAPAQLTAFQGLAMTVPTAQPATAGTYAILVTNGATVLNVNQFQQGYAVVAAGTGIGQTFKIASHAAAAANAKFVVTLEDPINVTLDATSTISLIYNPYGGGFGGNTVGSGIVVHPTTATGVPVGVTLYALSASTAVTCNGTTGLLTTNGVAQYGLIVCKGPASVLADDNSTAVGLPVAFSDATPGAVGTQVATEGGQVGIAMQTLTSATNGMVYLTL